MRCSAGVTRRLVSSLVLLATLAACGGSSAATADRRLVLVGTFASPVYVAATRADAKAIYVVEQAGRIVRVAGGKRSTFFDIRSQVVAGGEQGLLSIAFHPRYAKNRLFYVDYTSRPNGNTVIAELRARAGKKPLRLRTLMNLPDPAGNHNGGQLVFGPDGLLWWGNGDGGGGGDTYGNGQRAGGYFAKIMRQDVNRRPARWLTWAVGLRNPWRFSFDRANGGLYIGDVGQNEWEEIDYVPKGRSHLNFGWNRYEGDAAYGSEELLPGWKLTPPIHVYDHDDGCSVTGGYVYRGKAVASAVGRYFFGDYCTARVWSLVVEKGKATDVQREPFDVPGLSSFGEAADGELYLVSLNGPVYRLAG
jgi:glucose/arabinose dehydrogenase